MLKYNKTEISNINCQIIEQSGVQLIIKREFENHPFVSGNKWWKLKYNLAEAIKQNHHTLLTFGGAYSNHIYATAAAAGELGLKSIGVVRGEETLPLNPTLSFAKENGMVIHYLSRELYRKKQDDSIIHELQNQYGDFYLIPEGGTNNLAVKGVSEFAQQLNEEIDFDYICLPVGTGGTLAGLSIGLESSKKIIGIPVLKGAQFLEEEIRNYTPKQNWQLIYDYHFGGYAKTTNELLEFIRWFEEQFHIPLDQVYTAKMMFGIFNLIEKRFFPSGTTIVAIHTGGLQGKEGFNFLSHPSSM